MSLEDIQNNNDVLFSQVINFLRFPLIVAVVLLHSGGSSVIVQGVEFNMQDAQVYRTVSGFCTNVIGRLAVPLFFFISGYLFFYKTDFTGQVYGDKLKKRTRSLLVPYLFWNAALLMLYCIAAYIPIISSWFQGVELSWRYVVGAMWGAAGQDGMTYPIAYQFWFIRDLIVAVILTPVIYWIITRTRIFGVLFLGVLWYLDFSLPYIGSRGLSLAVVFFFTLGAWFSVNRKNILDIVGRAKGFAILYIPVAIADIVTKGDASNPYIHRLGILLGCVFVILLAAELLSRGRVRESAFLSSASFFLFAIHERWLLSQFKKVSFKVFQPQSDIALIMLYFGNAIAVIGVALVIYYVMIRFLPRFTALITGGR